MRALRARVINCYTHLSAKIRVHVLRLEFGHSRDVEALADLWNIVVCE